MKNLLKSLFKKEAKPTEDRFSDFFLHASADSKEELLTEAARKANEEQRELFNRAQHQIKTS